MSQSGARTSREIREAPEAVRRQEAALAEPLAELAGRLRRHPPKVAVTCARGSSAHAATFGKHVIERYLGIPVAAAAPVIASVYGAKLHLKDQLFLAISQSGASADLIEMTASARASGALTACIVNAAESPLAAECDIVLPMSAGAELSVAATKTFIATLSALLRLTSAWMDDTKLAAAVERLPERLAAAQSLDWSAAVDGLAGAASLVTIGRGPTLAIAREAALKLKETCNLHAEAFSGAEFLHGPVALAAPEYPILMFNPADAAAEGMRRLAANLREKGTALYSTDPEDEASARLPVLRPDCPETDAVCLIQSFYIMVVSLAERLGTDVDRPRHLRKVTSTR